MGANGWDIEKADEYIRYNTIDNEDWFEAEDERKIALLNVSSSTLNARFKRYLEDEDFPISEMPDSAVYTFAAVLAWVYNDTNKMAQQGVASASIRGISITFKDWARKDLYDFIPESIFEDIGVPFGNRVIPLLM